jgi:hypothetical protein
MENEDISPQILNLGTAAALLLGKKPSVPIE